MYVNANSLGYLKTKK